MDCMELAQDGSIWWIPKVIPNIDHRIEPLLWLERLFSQLGWWDSSGIFGGHKLKFSMESFSDLLLVTLSTYKDSDDIQVHWGPHAMNEFTITALNDDHLHHPAVWRDLYKNTYHCGLLYSYRTCVQGDGLNPGTFFGPRFTSKMYLKFLTAIYTSEQNRSISPTCTLVDGTVQVYKRNITALLSLLTKHPLNRYESNEKGLLFAIMHFHGTTWTAISQLFIHANIILFLMTSSSGNYCILRCLQSIELYIPIPIHF